MEMKPHQNLVAWQVSCQLVKELYLATALFPASEKFGIVSQIRRAAISIPANIAEGAGRQSMKEYQHFLSISMGSVSELDTLLIVSKSIGYLKENEFQDYTIRLEHISKLIHGLIKKIKSRITPGT